MTSIEPELWVGDLSAAVDFYARAFGATVLHRVGDGGEIVAQLAVGERASGSRTPDLGGWIRESWAGPRAARCS